MPDLKNCAMIQQSTKNWKNPLLESYYDRLTKEGGFNHSPSRPNTTPAPSSLAEHLLRMPDVGLDEDFDTRHMPG